MINLVNRRFLFLFFPAILVTLHSQLWAQTRPRGLALGDTIMFVAPAGEVLTDDVVRAKQKLEQMGYVVQYDEDITRQRGYLAGTDEQRAREFMKAFSDRNVDAVFCFTGGYGTMRMLDRLDFDVIAANPKIMCGFSDITGLHLAFAAKANMVTFHSPNVDSGISKTDGLNKFSAESFWKNVLANQAPEGYAYEPPAASPLETIHTGVGRGKLTGGNLSLVAALTGTPYEIETDGKVVFLEDVHEAPYRVDRMLSQLRLAGKLSKPAAVVLGKFTDAAARPGDATLTMQEVFRDYFADVAYPVVVNFPAGHHAFNATLPMGVEVEVDADKKVVRVLTSPVLTESAN